MLELKNKKQINNEFYITTGILAEALKIHQRTLRIWDKEGILSPGRTSKNRRCYTSLDFEKAKLILFLTRNLAINLAGVKVILLFLKKNNVRPEKFIDYIDKMTMVDIKTQEENIIKMKKKGKRKK